MNSKSNVFYFSQAKKGRWIILSLGLLLLVGAGCFKTRTVEPPVTGSSDWVSPSDYSILLQNFKRSITNTNAQNYLRCFNADSLKFVPATAVFGGNEILWQNWEVKDEQTYFNNVVSNLGILSGNSLELEEVDLQTFSSDSVKYIGQYTLNFNHNDTSLTTTFLGQMELIIKLNSFNEWEIHRWTDFETHTDSSWSHLKLGFGQ